MYCLVGNEEPQNLINGLCLIYEQQISLTFGLIRVEFIWELVAACHETLDPSHSKIVKV